MSILWLTLYIIQISFNFASCQRSENIEIKSLIGEPNYKSVNLTWLVENDNNRSDSYKAGGFFIFYCELQSWGSHRCKSKTLTDNEIETNDNQKQYSIVIDNLRMATKYSFHVKPSAKLGEQKATGRSDFSDNELNSDFEGERIVVPTKGFSAHATTCLPHASEIEVETGPYFGGIIMTENNEGCRIQGNYQSEQDRYILRIDHEKCCSKVDYETLTVKTFITVQENLGIFTHSTRRFVVMCSYQPDTLTVRASFSVPAKSGLSSSSPKNNDTDRESRKRSFRMVGKDALLLKKESNFDNLSGEEIGNKEEFFGDILEVSKQRGELDNKNIKTNETEKFDRLVHDLRLPNNEKSRTNAVLVILLTVSVILIIAFVFILFRKGYKRRLVKM